MKEILKIQPTEQNPALVENYPYGFKKTSCRFWVESVKNKGDRFCKQTLNPKTQEWNKPKKSVYSAVAIVYKNEKGHIVYYAYNRSTDETDYNKFMEFVGDFEFNEIQKEELRILRAYIKTYKNVSYSIRPKQFKHKQTGEIVERVSLTNINDYEEVSEEEQKEEQAETQDLIKKSVMINYAHNI